ncbi:MAG TPA: hypothetical protein DE191_02940 [Enterobacter sp.]|nr:hypothetical protein [Enterobacter sp.]
MVAFLSAIYGLLSALLLKTASHRVCLHLTVNVNELLYSSLLCEEEIPGYRAIGACRYTLKIQ